MGMLINSSTASAVPAGTTIYTVPTGKTLYLTFANFFATSGTAMPASQGIVLEGSTTGFVAEITTGQSSASVAPPRPIIFPSGSTIDVRLYGGGTSVAVGYTLIGVLT